MRHLLLILSASGLFAQQPILYNRSAVNAASLAPFGLPNAPIARGSVFTVSGAENENLRAQRGLFMLHPQPLDGSPGNFEPKITINCYETAYPFLKTPCNLSEFLFTNRRLALFWSTLHALA